MNGGAGRWLLLLTRARLCASNHTRKACRQLCLLRSGPGLFSAPPSGTRYGEPVPSRPLAPAAKPTWTLLFIVNTLHYFPTDHRLARALRSQLCHRSSERASFTSVIKRDRINKSPHAAQATEPTLCARRDLSELPLIVINPASSSEKVTFHGK